MPRRSKPSECGIYYYRCQRCGSIYADTECEGGDMEADPTCQYCYRKYGPPFAMDMERCPSPYTAPDTAPTGKGENDE